VTIDQVSDETKSREQLIQELAALRARLTDKKKLRENEERYRSFFYGNHAAMLLIDPLSEKIVNANSAACDYYGYTLDEITRRKITDINILLNNRVHSEPQWAESNQGRHIFSKHRLADGRIRDVEVFSGPIFIKGRELLFFTIHDVTERNEAEEALSIAERKYRKLLRHAPAAIYEIDFRNKRFTSINEAMCQMLGYSRKELLAMNPFDLIIEDDKTRFQDRISRELKGGEPERNVEYKIRTRDGRIIDTVLNVTFSINGHGKPASAMVVAHDITMRKQEERQINRYNAILRGINRIFGQVIRAETEDSLGETCLSVALEVTGSQIGFLGELGTDGLLHDISISDMAWHQCRMHDQAGHRRLPGDFKVHGLYGQVVLDGKSFYTNDPLSHPRSIGLPQGHPQINCFLGVPFTHGGKTIGVLAVANRQSGYGNEQQEDLEAIAPAVVSALLRRRAEQALGESEERLRLATEAADMYGWEVDLTTRAFKWSENAEQVVDFSMPATLTEVWELIHPEDLAEMKETMEQALENFGEFKVEYRIGNRAPDEELWVFSAGLAITDKSGMPTRVVGVTQNITRRKKIERDLRQLNETLEQQVAERTDLAETRARQLQSLAVDLIEAEERERQRIATLLHDDLQQLLAAGRMQLQAAGEGLPPDSLLANVGKLLEESISKTRQLSHELSPPVLHHSNLITALKWLARNMNDKFGLKVQLDAETEQFEHSHLKVFLFRAVQELLFNIVKHAGVNVAHVGLSTSSGGFLVTVTDQGQGFDPGILQSTHILAGLGLVSLRERTRSIGGDLVIESAPGQGSRFALTVPHILGTVKKPQQLESAADQLSSPLPVGCEAPAVTEGIRVLFVDDHKVMRQGLISMISGNPDIHVIGEAANGREALERVRQLRPDVVVMDVSMPVMDGVEATRRIKAEFPEVRVIGLSMFKDDHIARTIREAGAEAFLSKSASTAQLLKAIYGMDHHQRIKSDARVYGS